MKRKNGKGKQAQAQTGRRSSKYFSTTEYGELLDLRAANRRLVLARTPALRLSVYTALNSFLYMLFRPYLLKGALITNYNTLLNMFAEHQQEGLGFIETIDRDHPSLYLKMAQLLRGVSKYYHYKNIDQFEFAILGKTGPRYVDEMSNQATYEFLQRSMSNLINESPWIDDLDFYVRSHEINYRVQTYTIMVGFTLMNIMIDMSIGDALYNRMYRTYSANNQSTQIETLLQQELGTTQMCQLFQMLNNENTQLKKLPREIVSILTFTGIGYLLCVIYYEIYSHPYENPELLYIIGASNILMYLIKEYFITRPDLNKKVLETVNDIFNNYADITLHGKVDDVFVNLKLQNASATFIQAVENLLSKYRISFVNHHTTISFQLAYIKKLRAPAVNAIKVELSQAYQAVYQETKKEEQVRQKIVTESAPITFENSQPCRILPAKKSMTAHQQKTQEILAKIEKRRREKAETYVGVMEQMLNALQKQQQRQQQPVKVKAVPETQKKSQVKNTSEATQYAPQTRIYNIMAHFSESMINIQFADLAIDKSHDNLVGNYIKGLAFIYHFHCYNIAQYLLTKSELSKQLRTNLVHTINEREINTHELIQVQDVLNAKAKINLTDLDLYQSLNSHLSITNQKITEHRKTRPLEILHWTKNTIIPFINFIDYKAKTDKHDSDAIKLLIIVLGEYCNRGNLPVFKEFMKDANNKKYTEVFDFLQHAHWLRNKLAHNMEGISETLLQDFLAKAYKVDTSIMTPNAETIPSLLIPGSTKREPVLAPPLKL